MCYRKHLSALGLTCMLFATRLTYSAVTVNDYTTGCACVSVGTLRSDRLTCVIEAILAISVLSKRGCAAGSRSVS
eukprot:6481890-Amphidinium_carterae.2